METLWKNWIGVCVSLFIAILPFLGFPSNFRTFLFVLSGLFLVFIFFSIAGDHYKYFSGAFGNESNAQPSFDGWSVEELNQSDDEEI